MTKKPVVIGGLYWEHCLFPLSDALYGSGGRAASFLASLGASVSLLSVADLDAQRRFLSHAAAYGMSCSFDTISRTARFYYTHPLAEPVYHSPITGEPRPRIDAEGESILAFGMLDATISIRGGRVVYDPQSPSCPVSFRSIGVADELVIIVNEEEAQALSGGHQDVRAAEEIAVREGASAVIVKQGPRGCAVWFAEGAFRESCYRTPRVYKVGSGDVFSSAFFYEWALCGAQVRQAVRAAARATAIYCEVGEVALRAEMFTESARSWRRAEVDTHHRGVYIAAPFFTTAQRWLVGEIQRVLQSFGLKVFSPLHDVGFGLAKDIVERDLTGLRESSVVLVVVDGLDVGSIFEAGVAYSEDKRVIAVAENTSSGALTMLEGCDSQIFDDLAAALYACCWK